MPSGSQGPLRDVKVVEFGSIGPGPFTGMLLSRMGADVVRLSRPGEAATIDLPGAGADQRGRPSVVVDLKEPPGRDLALEAIGVADVVIEGFRPGVMERLGLGPDVALDLNPGVVYGRMTGYGQSGPLADVPGHDINYLAVAGVLGALRRPGERPPVPLNLIGDYGGGAMVFAFGLLCALLESRRSGTGQVVDAAMTDGAAQLATIFFALDAAGGWGPPGTNVLDGGAPFYDTYETADGRFVAVGAIEPQFYAALLEALGIDAAEAPQWERAMWPTIRARFAAAFRAKTRDEWAKLEAENACITPVLELGEAPAHPHNVARNVFRHDHQGLVPQAAPRFSRTPPTNSSPDDDGLARLAAWGVAEPGRG